jgi:choline dehydrogenase-like flavoprotein
VRINKRGQAYFDYRLGNEEKKFVRHGMSKVARMHHAAGAQKIITLHAERLAWERDGRQSIEAYCDAIERASIAPNRLPLFSAHQMGTCRIGSDRASAVCDANGAVFGMSGAYVADASLFPASSGVNPMITVMALARYIGQRIP